MEEFSQAKTVSAVGRSTHALSSCSLALPHGPQGPSSAGENWKLLKPSGRKGATQAEAIQEKYPD